MPGPNNGMSNINNPNKGKPAPLSLSLAPTASYAATPVFSNQIPSQQSNMQIIYTSPAVNSHRSKFHTNRLAAARARASAARKLNRKSAAPKRVTNMLISTPNRNLTRKALNNNSIVKIGRNNNEPTKLTELTQGSRTKMSERETDPDKILMNFVTITGDPMVNKCIGFGQELNINVKEIFKQKCIDKINELIASRKAILNNTTASIIEGRYSHNIPVSIEDENIFGDLPNGIRYPKILFHYIRFAFKKTNGYLDFIETSDTPIPEIITFMETMAKYMVLNRNLSRQGRSEIIGKNRIATLGYMPHDLHYPLPENNIRAQNYSKMRGIDLFQKMTVLTSKFKYNEAITYDFFIKSTDAMAIDIDHMIDSIAAFACYCIYYMQKKLKMDFTDFHPPIIPGSTIKRSIAGDIIELSNMPSNKIRGGKHKHRTHRKKRTHHKKRTYRRKH